MIDTKQSGFWCKTLALFMVSVIALGVTVIAWDVFRERGILPRGCATGTLDVKGMGLLNGVYTDGANTRLLLRPAADEVKVVTVDTCSGQLLGALTFSADTPEALAAAAAAQQKK